MIDGYPDEDSPFTFYFNGEEMPRWTSTWSLIPVDFWGEHEDWIADLCWRIYCRIDHVGCIETEDSNLLSVCILWHMRCLVDKEKEVRLNIFQRLSESEQREPIYENLFHGLNRMLDLSRERKICCWTNGYAQDQQRLMEFMSQTHDLFPHQKTRLEELEMRSFFELKRMRRIASTKKLPTTVREGVLERTNKKAQ